MQREERKEEKSKKRQASLVRFKEVKDTKHTNKKGCLSSNTSEEKASKTSAIFTLSFVGQ